MSSFKHSALVFHANQQMFDIVNNVALYPQFLPWCQNAVVHHESAQEMLVELKLGKGAVQFNLTTMNTLRQPDSIEMQLNQGPFQYLQGKWSFHSLKEDACRVDFELSYEVAGVLQKLAIGKMLAIIAKKNILHFCHRADAIYGTHKHKDTSSG